MCSGQFPSKFGLHTLQICIYMSYNMEVRGKAWEARGCSRNGPKSEIDGMRSRLMRPSGLGRGCALWHCGRLGAYFRKKEPAPKIYFAYNFLSRLPIEVILGSLESHNVQLSFGIKSKISAHIRLLKAKSIPSFWQHLIHLNNITSMFGSFKPSSGHYLIQLNNITSMFGSFKPSFEHRLIQLNNIASMFGSFKPSLEHHLVHLNNIASMFGSFKSYC